MTAARVLIVDDHLPNLELAGFVLAAGGMQVMTADSAAAARAVLRSFEPDIILMDLQMPDVDGLTAMRQIKADPAFCSIRIVAFTAYAMAGDAEKLISAGFDGYVSKPIDVGRFVADVLGCVGHAA